MSYVHGQSLDDTISWVQREATTHGRNKKKWPNPHAYGLILLMDSLEHQDRVVEAIVNWGWRDGFPVLRPDDRIGPTALEDELHNASGGILLLENVSDFSRISLEALARDNSGSKLPIFVLGIDNKNHCSSECIRLDADSLGVKVINEHGKVFTWDKPTPATPVGASKDDLAVINKHRASLGMGKLDPNAGWSEKEISDMAQSIRTTGRMTNPREKIRGGRSSGMKPSQFDQKALKRGIAIELEHTPSRRIAQEIAMDHLTERPDYYEILAKVGLNPRKPKRGSNTVGSRSMARSNPSPESHRKQAKTDLQRAGLDLERAHEHLRAGKPAKALQEAAQSLVASACARCEAENGGDQELSKSAVALMRDAGRVIMEGVGQVQVTAASARQANPHSRHPGGKSNMLIRTHSSSLLAGMKDIYLVINTEGQVMDAVITEPEDFTLIEKAHYGSLPILELDISGAQYRKLIKLAKQLQTVVKARPVHRPSRGQALERYGSSTVGSIYGSGAAANPLKRRLMR